MSFVIMAIVLLVASKKLEKSDPLNRAFLISISAVMLGLLSESATVLLNGKEGFVYIFANNLLSAILFAVAPMLGLYFFLFIFHMVLPDKKISKPILTFMLIPVLICIISAFLSPFFGLVFAISDIGVYSRGPFFIASVFLTYIFLVVGIIIILINAKRLVKHELLLMLAVGVIPIGGGIIQSLYYGVLTMWSSAGIALLIGYLFLQDRMIQLDSLTGAWNRESFYYTYSRRIKLNPEKSFGAIYFDIDNLKQINDTYGHLEGDSAIILLMDVIKEVLPYGSNICRLGGDEFIIIYDCETEEEINNVLADIKENIATNEKITSREYKLECSFGAAIYTPEFISINALVSKLDKLMYEEKFAKKAVRK
jgi:diguanylate cyclase (GGDEF)-like protein